MSCHTSIGGLALICNDEQQINRPLLDHAACSYLIQQQFACMVAVIEAPLSGNSRHCRNPPPTLHIIVIINPTSHLPYNRPLYPPRTPCPIYKRLESIVRIVSTR
jgi:hypothetical protein